MRSARPPFAASTGHRLPRRRGRSSTGALARRPREPLGLDEAARPRLVGAHLALAAQRCRLDRVEPAVLSAQRAGQRRVRLVLWLGRDLARQPGLEVAVSSARRFVGQLRPRAPARVSSPSSGTRRCATIGPVSRPASMRISVTPVSGRRPGSRPGSASRRDGAAAATDGGSARRGAAVEQRLRARSGRSRQARAGPAPSARISVDRVRCPQAAGRSVGTPLLGRPVGDGRIDRLAARSGRARRGDDRRRGRRCGCSSEGGDDRARRMRPCRERWFAPGGSSARRHASGASSSSSASASSSSCADRDQLVHRVEVVDVQLAVEMIELVLQRARQQALAVDLDLAAVAVLGHDPDLLASRHVGDVARDRQAALEIAVVAVGCARSWG